MTQIFTANGTSLKDFTNGIASIGIVQTAYNEPVSGHESSLIEASLPSSLRWRMKKGDVGIQVRETRDYQNGEDTIRGIDFDVVENRVVTNSDPVYVISGPTEHRTAQFVKEVLEQEIRKDIIKAALTDGIDSQFFEVSVADLARLLNKNQNQVYNECIKLLVSGSVATMKDRLTVSSKETAQIPRVVA